MGYLAAQIKSVQDARVGDTVTLKKTQASEPLSGYEDVQPMVYCGLFPTDTDDYQVRLRKVTYIRASSTTYIHCQACMSLSHVCGDKSALSSLGVAADVYLCVCVCVIGSA